MIILTLISVEKWPLLKIFSERYEIKFNNTLVDRFLDVPTERDNKQYFNFQVIKKGIQFMRRSLFYTVTTTHKH